MGTWAGFLLWDFFGITPTFLMMRISFHSEKKMLDHLDPKCQLVELICGSVFSHAHELSTNLCEMEISRVGGAWSHSLVHTVHTVLISQAWQWKVFFLYQEFFIYDPTLTFVYEIKIL